MDNIFPANLKFLSGGGEMALLVSRKDWSKTVLGIPEHWPSSLRTSLGIVLNSRFPMFLFWGKELLCFYNDAYRLSLGDNGKHPAILGIKAQDAWPETWEVIKPKIESILAGDEATIIEDQRISIFRNGNTEELYWTYSYSRVNDANGNIEGVLITCNETTEKLKTLSQVAESEERFRNMAESSEILIALGDETGNATYFNKAWATLTGRPM